MRVDRWLRVDLGEVRDLDDIQTADGAFRDPALRQWMVGARLVGVVSYVVTVEASQLSHYSRSGQLASR